MREGLRIMAKKKKCARGKVIFRTELDAKIALSSRVWRDKGEKRAYKCELGDHWHLSSQDADPGRRMTASTEIDAGD